MALRRRARARHARRGARRRRARARRRASARPVIGINARDLSTFAIDRARAARPRRTAQPRDRVVVAESGVHSRAQGAAAELAGADAILVGSALMRRPTRRAKLRELLVAPARQGLRAHARGGRRRRGRGRAPTWPASSSPPESPRARARRCSPCPRRCSSVAVWVGERRGDERRPRPGARARERAVRGRDAVLLRGGDAGRARARPAVGGGGSRPLGARRGGARAASCSPAGSAPTNVRDGDRRAVRPWAVDASSRLEVEPGIKDHAAAARYVRGAPQTTEPSTLPADPTAAATSPRR